MGSWVVARVGGQRGGGGGIRDGGVEVVGVGGTRRGTRVSPLPRWPVFIAGLPVGAVDRLGRYRGVVKARGS